jgi:hypothetical protein
MQVSFVIILNYLQECLLLCFGFFNSVKRKRGEGVCG